MARPAAGSASGARVGAAFVLAGCLAVLGVAAWLKPDPRGYGTHEQFGTGPCGWMLVLDYPCPTCGMTTAFAHTVRLQWWRAIVAQPAGFFLALTTVVMAVIAARTLVIGRWPVRLWWKLTPYRLFVALLVVLLGGWAYKLIVTAIERGAELG